VPDDQQAKLEAENARLRGRVSELAGDLLETRGRLAECRRIIDLHFKSEIVSADVPRTTPGESEDDGDRDSPSAAAAGSAD
jgi:hypothetical protein